MFAPCDHKWHPVRISKCIVARQKHINVVSVNEKKTEKKMCFRIGNVIGTSCGSVSFFQAIFFQMKSERHFIESVLVHYKSRGDGAGGWGEEEPSVYAAFAPIKRLHTNAIHTII